MAHFGVVGPTRAGDCLTCWSSTMKISVLLDHHDGRTTTIDTHVLKMAEDLDRRLGDVLVVVRRAGLPEILQLGDRPSLDLVKDRLVVHD
jgi:hypothetical protein